MFLHETYHVTYAQRVVSVNVESQELIGGQGRQVGLGKRRTVLVKVFIFRQGIVVHNVCLNTVDRPRRYVLPHHAVPRRMIKSSIASIVGIGADGKLGLGDFATGIHLFRRNPPLEAVKD